MENTTDTTCPVCLEVKKLRMFQCHHGVCPDCSAQLRKPTCPLCRADNRQDFQPEELAGMDRRNHVDRAHRVEQEFQDLRRADPGNLPEGALATLARVPGNGRVRLTQGDWENVLRRTMETR